MTCHSTNTDRARERVQSFHWNQAQHGNIYVPDREPDYSRVERVEKVIKGVEEQFPPNSYSAQKQVQGQQSGMLSMMTTNMVGHEYAHFIHIVVDLNGVGQQFQS